MYLSELEILGFKSFGQKVKIKFSDGITAIVGPNGCGKTNIVDAIRWVLGEQKTSTLRSDTMENVIFNGNKTRKPLGMAEVNISIENNRSVLSTEYSSVNVSRILFRDGESRYMINKTRCRLKDIQNLFMDTGLGPDSYSVIELKMVEGILSGKVDERRHLFEEAAGVTKYKIRRKETARKLQAVQSDLERVQDIVSEVQKNVNSLSRQATKTRRYNKLIEELKAVELRLAAAEYLNLKKAKAGVESEALEYEKQKNKIVFELHDNEKKLKALRDEYESVDRNFQEAINAETAAAKALAFQNQELAVSEERIKALKLNLQKLIQEKHESGSRRARINDFLAQSEEKLSRLLSSKDEIIVDDKKEMLEFARKELKDARDNLNAVSMKHYSAETELSNKRLESKKNKEKRASLERRINSLEFESQAYLAKIKELQNKIEDLNLLKEDHAKRIEDLERDKIAAQAKKTELDAIVDELRNKINEKRNTLSSRKASLEFLEGLIDANEVNKSLIKSNEWTPKGEKTLLIEAVTADEEYRAAIEAALGEAAQYFVVESKEDAIAAINLLEKSARGKATFICKDLISASAAEKEGILPESAISFLADVVNAPEPLMNLLKSMWKSSVLVKGKAEAAEALKVLGIHKAVTLSGEIFTRDGLIRGGSKLQTEGRTVGRKERISSLKKEIDSLAQELEGINLELQRSQEETAKINLADFDVSLKKSRDGFQSTIENIHKNEIQRSQNESNLENINQNIKTVKADLAELDASAGSDDGNLSELIKAVEDIKAEAEKAKLNLRQLEDKYAAADSDLKKEELKLLAFDKDIESTEKDIANYKRQLENEDKRAGYRDNDIEGNKKETETLETKKSEIAAALENGEAELADKKSKKDFLNINRKDLNEKIVNQEAEIEDIRSKEDSIKDTLHRLDIKLNEFKLKIETLYAKSKDDLGIDLATAEPATEESLQEIETTRSTAASIKTKLVELGAVNFMALEEFEEQNERLDFYNKQVSDLIESEKTLQETIIEINETAEKKFLETFEQIKINFVSLFKTLFGDEAECELSLEEGNPLETDIIIKAKPPGKKPHSIEMLSGGEKTLTAISLLFAIYLVKPSPFCILDEVDAPLDDANIERFIKMIKRFSENTQFLIVTHNKKTMAAADNLYGITQQEEGLSKVVSVRIKTTEDAL